MLNVIFVKHGTKYCSDDVNRLYRSLLKYRSEDVKYHCYTEDFDGLDRSINKIYIPAKPSLKKWWNKLPMFSSDFPLKGKVLYFDLDTMIKEDPFTILEDVDWDALTLINCHWKSDQIYDRPTNYDVRINSSIITWTAENPKIHEIWDYFINKGYKDYFLRKYVGIDRYIVHEGFPYQTFDPKYIQSYKFEPYKNAPITTFEEIDYEKFSTVSRSESN